MVAAWCNRRDRSQFGRLALASLSDPDPARDESRGRTQDSKILTFQRSGVYVSFCLLAIQYPA